MDNLPAARNDVFHPSTRNSELGTRNLIIIGFILLFFLPSCVSLQNHYARGEPVKIRKKQLAQDNTKNQQAQKPPDETPAAKIQVEDEKKLHDLNLRVLLAKSGAAVEIKSDAPIGIKGMDSFPASNSCSISIAGHKLNVNGYTYSDNELEFESKQYIEVKGRSYRGAIIATEDGGQLLIINRVALDQYLYGVLPSEVPPGWPMEFLKAQAVAARSFALYNRLNSKVAQYDLDSNVMSQVYKGVDIESRQTNQAVDATRDEVASRDGSIIQAFFHSNSGGRTATSEEVWGGKCDYLQSVDDNYCSKEQHYKWEFKVDRDKLSDILAKNKLKTGEIYEIRITDRTGSGRVKSMKILGSDGTAEVQGKDFRAYAGVDNIKSTNFTVEARDNKFIFEGLGWGHGVGMSQEGGKGMAEAGRTYKEILQHFYQGVEITKAKIEQ
jgi:stage II sporulation protein D